MTDGIFRRLKRRLSPRRPEKDFNQYVPGMPQHQNAIDMLPGWNSTFPGEYNLKAGSFPLHVDDRIIAAIRTYGALRDKLVLEIGPLEGMHTYLLNKERPARIDAIEANRLCFMRCLVTKEILQLDRARFYLGDIQPWLETGDTVYDFALASGVLYHLPDPAEFLVQLSRRARAVFLWTHFFDEDAMPPGDPRRRPFSGRIETRTVAGLAVRHHERGYRKANRNAAFCGGMKDRHYWLQRDEILALLARLGYTDIRIFGEEPAHPGGPCFSVYASRP